MDKYEYNLRNEEINALIGSREFQKAVAIADTIDWTKVRSVRTLCKISDLYKVNRRYNEAKILLEQALDRCPTGKSIVSSLCELCIKMEDIVGATEYYKLFLQMAPNDYNKYILLYKIYETQGATLDERIEVLEELKKKERIEKWCYELAYLYHKIGLTTRCVEECDDIILWFREGKFVKKAMELKMLHQQLTQSQDALYQNMLNPKEKAAHIEQIKSQEVAEINNNENEDILVKTVDVGQYSTINIQKALEESIRDTLGENPQFDSGDLVETAEDSTVFLRDNQDYSEPIEKSYESDSQNVVDSILAPLMQDTGEMQELFFETEEVEEESESEVDENGNVENEAPNFEEEITESEMEGIEESEDIGEVEELEEIIEEVLPEEKPVVDIKDQVAFPDMPVSEDTIIYNKGDITNQVRNAVFGSDESKNEEIEPKVNLEYASKEELMDLIDRKVAEALEHAITSQSALRIREKEKTNRDSITSVAPPRSMQRMLSQEYDGQISLVIPEQEKVDKQITGQINIEEYLSNWEDTKRQRQQQAKQQIQNELSKETGALFSEFEAKARDSILEKIEAESKNGKTIDPDKEYEEYISSIMEVDSTEEEKSNDEEYSLNIPDAKIDDSFDGLNDFEEPNKELLVEEAVDTDKNSLDEVEKEESESDEKEIAQNDTEQIEEKNSESQEAITSTEKSDESEGRPLTEEELNLFAKFVQTKKAKQNLSKALDSISLASYTGNVFVTGDTGEGAVDLSRNVVQYVKSIDSNFSGKIGKVSGSSLNGKDVAATVERMKNGGLIIEKAGDMNADTVKALIKVLNQDNMGILVVMQDTNKVKNRIFGHFDGIKQIFNVHIEIEELSDDALVAYGRQYAEHMEYSIDEMGILALHTRIDELQTSDHSVTVEDVRDIVDEAIEHATRFSPKHITDVILGKRYDEEDMIILKERDFTN